MNVRVRTLLLRGLKAAGSYDPEEVLDHIEQELTEEERDRVVGFLEWVCADVPGRGFGRDTLPDRHSEWLASRRA